MSPQCPLLLAANRDESFARPTRQAHLWPGRQLIAGRDLQAGGIWLGVSPDGRFAAVTNVREPARNGAGLRSRGELPLGFLGGTKAPAEYLEGLAGTLDQYAGFNLLVGDVDAVLFTSNRASGIHELTAGIVGLANGASGPDWPKVVRGKAKFRDLLASGEALHCELLTEQMRDAQRAEESELPDTGLPTERESRLSSMFIPALPDGYGTRSSSAFIRRGDGRCEFLEQNFNASGEVAERHWFGFDLAGKLAA